MPELVEIELYRRLAEQIVGRTIASVDAPDAWYLKRGTSAVGLADRLVGGRIGATRRRGKLLLLDVGDRRGRVATTLGLRFGMTGRLVVNGSAGIDELIYSSAELRPEWDRFALGMNGGARLVINDPRRLGGVELDPPIERMGPDALDVKPAQLTAALSGCSAPLKARLMDQNRLAGVGNLIADEVLWRARLDPLRAAGGLSQQELVRLHRSLRAALRDLLDGGGSHTGRLMAARVRGGRCPRCRTPLLRRTIGGRTTYSCPRDQR